MSTTVHCPVCGQTLLSPGGFKVYLYLNILPKHSGQYTNVYIYEGSALKMMLLTFYHPFVYIIYCFYYVLYWGKTVKYYRFFQNGCFFRFKLLNSCCVVAVTNVMEGMEGIKNDNPCGAIYCQFLANSYTLREVKSDNGWNYDNLLKVWLRLSLHFLSLCGRWPHCTGPGITNMVVCEQC